MHTPLDLRSVERALDGALAAGAEALAVCLLHAYLNPAHERVVADAAKGRAPGLPVSCSADVIPEYREFERFSTTVLNAYLQPLMDAYLSSLEERLLATGYAHGVLTVGSSGGMMTTDTARRLPIKTIFSGPAGGVSQACYVGATAGVLPVRVTALPSRWTVTSANRDNSATTGSSRAAASVVIARLTSLVAIMSITISCLPKMSATRSTKPYWKIMGGATMFATAIRSLLAIDFTMRSPGSSRATMVVPSNSGR